jgi:steroid delta-isomerase-like uncharacterized protein
MTLKTTLAAGALAVAAMGPGLAAAAASDANAQRYREMVEIVFNKGDLAAADGYFAADVVDHAPWPGQPADIAGFKAGLAELRTSFPDLRVTVEHTVEEGDMLAAHLRISGSQLGPFMDAPPSGRTFSVEAFDLVRLQEGRIAEHWGVIDTATMAAQLGL